MREISSARLKFTRFFDDDVPQLARLLADLSLTRHFTANGSTNELGVASARKRIAWNNSTWDDH